MVKPAEGFSGKTLVVGGDGRFYNDTAIQLVIKMALAQGFSKILIGQNGILSTPAVSNIIREYGAFGGVILSASHNAGGPDGDFGIKFNIANGGPAPEKITDAIYAYSQTITHYEVANCTDVNLNALGVTTVGNAVIEIIDSVADYVVLMQKLFDFDAIRALFKSGFTMRFDAMHAVTGPYAHTIFEDIFKQQKDYSVFILDFDGITSVTEDFLEKYLLYYLESKFKILNVNMSLIVEAAWSSVVDSFFVSQYENTVEVKTGNKEVSTYYCND